MNLWKTIANEASPILRELWEENKRYTTGQKGKFAKEARDVESYGWLTIISSLGYVLVSMFFGSWINLPSLVLLALCLFGFIFACLGNIFSAPREFIDDVRALKGIFPNAQKLSRNELKTKTAGCLSNLASHLEESQNSETLRNTEIPVNMRKEFKRYHTVLFKFDLCEERWDEYFPKK